MEKFKLVEIVTAEPVLVKLMNYSKEGKLDFKTSYWLKKLIDKLKPELEDYYSNRKELFERLGESVKNEEGTETGEYRILPENQEKFQKYFNELLEIEIELSNIRKFTVAELEKIEGISIDDISMFEAFIDELEEAPVERKKIKLSID